LLSISWLSSITENFSRESARRMTHARHTRPDTNFVSCFRFAKYLVCCMIKSLWNRRRKKLKNVIHENCHEKFERRFCRTVRKWDFCDLVINCFAGVMLHSPAASLKFIPSNTQSHQLFSLSVYAAQRAKDRDSAFRPVHAHTRINFKPASWILQFTYLDYCHAPVSRIERKG